MAGVESILRNLETEDKAYADDIAAQQRILLGESYGAGSASSGDDMRMTAARDIHLNITGADAAKTAQSILGGLGSLPAQTQQQTTPVAASPVAAPQAATQPPVASPPVASPQAAQASTATQLASQLSPIEFPDNLPIPGAELAKGILPTIAKLALMAILASGASGLTAYLMRPDGNDTDKAIGEALTKINATIQQLEGRSYQLEVVGPGDQPASEQQE
jgi:hypothetical protein